MPDPNSREYRTGQRLGQVLAGATLAALLAAVALTLWQVAR